MDRNEQMVKAVETVGKIVDKLKTDKTDKETIKEKHKKKNGKAYTKDEQLAYLWEQYGIK
jgi:hypothetical protein